LLSGLSRVVEIYHGLNFEDSLELGFWLFAMENV